MRTRHTPIAGAVLGALLLGAGSLAAQETQQPGQDTTMTAPDPSRTEDSLGRDTTEAAVTDSGAVRNPPGYRGMERPKGLDDSTAVADTSSGRKPQ